jgi:hypothetical protein
MTKSKRSVTIIDKGVVEGELHEYHFHPMLNWKGYGLRAVLIFGWRRGSRVMTRGEHIFGVVGHPDDLKDMFPKMTRQE